jgi:hypothetical protein
LIQQPLQELGLVKITTIPGAKGISEYEPQLERMCEYFNMKMEETTTPVQEEKAPVEETIQHKQEKCVERENKMSKRMMNILNKLKKQ